MHLSVDYIKGWLMAVHIRYQDTGCKENYALQKKVIIEA